MTKIVELYLDYHIKYQNLYGTNTLVLIQIGGFYEAYATDILGPDLLTISKLINTQRGKKGKNEKASIDHPYFVGFPVGSFCKFLNILLENDYIVVVIDQVYNSDKKTKDTEKREVTNIYSKGTYVENLEKNDGNYIMCAYFSKDPQKDSTLLSVGISLIDISTSHVVIHEAYSQKHDEYYALDETDRIIESYNPSEIFIFYQNNSKIKDKENYKNKILEYLKLDNSKCKFYDKIEKKYTTISTQNEILKKIYPQSESLITPIESLNLCMNIYIIVSMVAIFDIIYNKNPILLNNIMLPEMFSNTSNLILGNNALNQLNVLEKDKSTEKTKFKSLFHVINKTSTGLGERYLKNKLLSPSTDINKLNKSYDQIESLINSNSLNELEFLLDNIKDIERLERKIELRLLKPVELLYLIESYDNITKIIKLVENKIPDLKNLLPTKKIIEQIPNFSKHIDKIFIKDELFKYITYDIDTKIFKNGLYQDLDNLLFDKSESHLYIEKIKNSIDELLKKDNYNAKSTLGTTPKNGSFIKLTKKNGLYLKKKLFDDNIDLIVDGIKFDTSTLNFVEMLTENFKITLKMTNIHNFDDPKKRKDAITRLSKKYFLNELVNIYNIFSDVFIQCNKFIAIIDFIKSSAKTALAYGYSKPVLVDKSYSFVEIKKIRHPIVERIINYEYIPHDFELGKKNNKGMIIYGINSAGKSCFMKAIGLSVIMAQIGQYVPCESMILSPYSSLYTRITGDDNIFRGLSSFSLEMVELNAILKRSTKNTLIIGDEVCKGTEITSATAILSATLITLSKLKTSFVFASHFHNIMEFSEIQELENVHAFHLSVEFDKEKNILLFDRKLKKGVGEKIYGVTIAQYIIQNENFIDLAIKFRNKITNSCDGILSGKTSKYNSNVVIYKCHICDSQEKTLHVSNLEVHHINFQKDCHDGLVKDKKYIQKNSEQNLTVLCVECHDKIHSGKIMIDKMVMTSKGRQLSFVK
jgi:DNA mismatch repair protein MutS